MGSSKTIAVWLNSKLVIGVTLNILIFTEIATSTTKGLEAVLKSETRRHEAVPNIKHFSSTGSLSKSQLEGDTKDNSSSTSGQTNDLSAEFLRNSELSTIFCTKCTKSQREKVEQILYLLYNFSNNNNNPATESQLDKNYVLHKRKRNNNGFKATSSPIPGYRKNLPEMIPTPDTIAFLSSRRYPVPQLAPTSTTPAATTSYPSSSYSASSSVAVLPYFYSQTSPFPSSHASTTLSSALEQVQSVEMPTPPMPPTTSGPIYMYYLGGPSSSSSPSSSLSSSGSLEPPTTPVVASSVNYMN